MSSTSLRVLLVSALVVVCTHAAAPPTAKLSPQAKKVLDDVYGLSLSTKCSAYFTTTLPKTNYVTDTAVNALCTDIKTANNAAKLKTATCLAADFKKFETSACDKVTKLNNALAKKLKAYTADVISLSGPCTTAAGTVASWFDLEQLCSDVKTIKTAVFKKACPKDEYSKLEKAACGGASGVLVGLMTLGLCLVTSLFSKQ